jgi:hypothetical protein
LRKIARWPGTIAPSDYLQSRILDKRDGARASCLARGIAAEMEAMQRDAVAAMLEIPHADASRERGAGNARVRYA